uniref:Uncharacterized protein n=1 Tax=Saccharomyces cerevisiae TaxID=4932 RepID=A0A0H3WJY9_YEASX|nr:hypothetical protein [Saccharomyces cerevisiae]
MIIYYKYSPARPAGADPEGVRDPSPTGGGPNPFLFLRRSEGPVGTEPRRSEGPTPNGRGTEPTFKKEFNYMLNMLLSMNNSFETFIILLYLFSPSLLIFINN